MTETATTEPYRTPPVIIRCVELYREHPELLKKIAGNSFINFTTEEYCLLGNMGLLREQNGVFKLSPGVEEIAKEMIRNRQLPRPPVHSSR